MSFFSSLFKLPLAIITIPKSLIWNRLLSKAHPSIFVTFILTCILILLLISDAYGALVV